MDNMTRTVDLTQGDDRIDEETSKMRLTDSTRSRYASAVNHFKRCLASKHPELLDCDGNKILPTFSPIITAFMNHAMLNVDDNEEYISRQKFYSLYYVNAYRNFIKKLYQKEGFL